jgi:hypothetical protein
MQVCPSIGDYFSFHLLTFRRNIYVHAAQNASPLKRQGNKKKTIKGKFSLYQATSPTRDKRLVTVNSVGVSVRTDRRCSQWMNFLEI